MPREAGTARPRYEYGDEKDICLNCELPKCVYETGQPSSLMCQWNKVQVEKKKTRAELKAA